jgi:drug/metabolite transporter (DMT)-like permease
MPVSTVVIAAAVQGEVLGPGQAMGALMAYGGISLAAARKQRNNGVTPGGL